MRQRDFDKLSLIEKIKVERSEIKEKSGYADGYRYALDWVLHLLEG